MTKIVSRSTLPSTIEEVWPGFWNAYEPIINKFAFNGERPRHKFALDLLIDVRKLTITLDLDPINSNQYRFSLDTQSSLPPRKSTVPSRALQYRWKEFEPFCRNEILKAEAFLRSTRLESVRVILTFKDLSPTGVEYQLTGNFG